MRLTPGGVRELHWHPNNDEWQYYIEGRGRMTVFASESKARTFDYQAGDVGYVPFAMGHYIESTGETTLRFLEMFKSDHYADVSLAQWTLSTLALSSQPMPWCALHPVRSVAATCICMMDERVPSRDWCLAKNRLGLLKRSGQR